MNESYTVKITMQISEHEQKSRSFKVDIIEEGNEVSIYKIDGKTYEVELLLEQENSNVYRIYEHGKNFNKPMDFEADSYREAVENLLAVWIDPDSLSKNYYSKPFNSIRRMKCNKNNAIN